MSKHLVDCDGELVSVAEYCKKKGISYKAVLARHYKTGKSYEEVLSFYESGEFKSSTLYLVDCDGEMVSVSEYCRRRGISSSAVYDRRFKTGDSFENILAYYEENEDRTCRQNRTCRQRGTIKDLRFYAIWNGMIDRCTNPKHKGFETYSKLGIQDSWLNFENFQEDMYEEYLDYVDTHKDLPSIDRKNNNIAYFKENCHWIPKSMQNRNQDRNVWANEDELLIEYCERKNLRYDIMLYRIQAGYTLEEAEAMPMPKYKGKYLEYIGKNIREFNIVSLNTITHKSVITRCNICGEEISLSLYDLLHRNLNKGCSCRKGHKFYIGDNNYTYKELETLYNLSHEDMRKVIDSGDMSLFSNIINLTNEEWIELLKDIHSKW